MCLWGIGIGPQVARHHFQSMAPKLSLGLDERLALFRAQTAFDHRLQDLLLRDLGQVDLFGPGLFLLRLPVMSTRR